MARISKVPKGTNPPGVGSDRRKGKEKLIRVKQGGMASKDISEARGPFI